MAQIVNPRVEIDIFSAEKLTIKDLYIDFNISKDLSEEPNEAEVIIHNLSSSNRAKISNAQYQTTPIEIRMTPAGKTDFVVAFRGEIDLVNSRNVRPGYETIINATSQKDNHRAFYFEPKTYAKGSLQSQIIDDLVNAIGLPSQINREVLPDNTLLIAQTLSGPAFQLLAKYCEDNGCHAHIQDGILVISSIYIDTVGLIKKIKRQYLLSTPNLTLRTDSADIEMRTVFEATAVDPFAKKRRKKQTRRVKAFGIKSFSVSEPDEPDRDDYVEYEAVDKEIKGINIEILAQPDICPDDMIELSDHPDYLGNIYRVQVVNHFGNNYGGDWTTEIEADNYDISQDEIDADDWI